MKAPREPRGGDGRLQRENHVFLAQIEHAGEKARVEPRTEHGCSMQHPSFFGAQIP